MGRWSVVDRPVKKSRWVVVDDTQETKRPEDTLKEYKPSFYQKNIRPTLQTLGLAETPIRARKTITREESAIEQWGREGFPLEISGEAPKQIKTEVSPQIHNLITRFKKWQATPPTTKTGKYFQEQIPFYGSGKDTVYTTRFEEDARLAASLTLIGTIGYEGLKGVIASPKGQELISRFGYKVSPDKVMDIARKATTKGWQGLTGAERKVWQSINDSGIVREAMKHGAKLPFFKGGAAQPSFARIPSPIVKFYAGAPVPFKPNEVVRVGKELMRFVRASGDTAILLNQAGQEITARLSDLKPSAEPPTFKTTREAVDFGKQATPEQVERLKAERERLVAESEKLVEEDPLVVEARKYKTAEEFSKDYEILYHGGSEKIIGDKLSLGGRVVGEVTAETLGKGQDYGGIFFTPDKELAETFAKHSTTGKGAVHTFVVKKDKLFDRDNPKHRVALRNFIGKKYLNEDNEMVEFTEQMYDFVFPKLDDGKRYIDWATMEPNVLEAMGFEGAKVVEHFSAYGEGKHQYTTVLFKGGKDSPHWKIQEGQQLTEIWNKAQQKPTPAQDKKITETAMQAQFAREAVEAAEGKFKEVVKPEEQALITEAKKYKTAEEFVERQLKKEDDRPLYKEVRQLAKETQNLKPEQIEAKVIERFGKDPEITLYRGISPELRPDRFEADVEAPVGRFWAPNQALSEQFVRETGSISKVTIKVSDLLKSRLAGKTNLRANEIELAADLQKDIQEAPTKPQLTDIWKKAQGKPVEVVEEVPEVISKAPPAIPPEEVAGLEGPEGEGSETVVAYEKQKDIWIGNKDVRILQSKIEKRELQKEIPAALGKTKYDAETQKYDKAIQLYIDTKRNPEHIAQYYDKLTPEQKGLVDLSQSLPDNIKAIADKIAASYKQIGFEALEEDVIRNVLENYAARVWDIEGKAATEKFRKFSARTRHAKARKFGTIIEGWANDMKLKVEGATSNLQILKEEIVKTIEDKKFLKTLQKIKTIDGEPLVSTRQLEGYIPIEHPNFKVWRYAGKVKPEEEGLFRGKWKGEKTINDVVRKMGGISPNKLAGFTISDFKEFGISSLLKEGGQALDDIADELIGQGVLFSDMEDTPSNMLIDALQNKHKLSDYAEHLTLPEKEYVFGKNFFRDEEGNLFEKRSLYAPKEQAKNLNNILGVSKLKGIPGVDFATKWNAVIKSWILQSSFFHHLAFMRSYWFGTNHKQWNEMSVRQAYRQGITAIEEENPVVMLGVKNGLTLGLKQDWDEEILRETSKLDEYLNKNKVVGPVKDKILDLRQKHVDFLFGEFGAGLKAKSFIVEFRNLTKKHPDKSSDEIAKMAANLINDDFGGLHLQRMGRNPTVQHVFRLFALAPDWTESNVRTMVKAFKAGSKEETKFYRRFWAGIFTKGAILTVLGNALMAGLDKDDEEGKGLFGRMTRNYKRAWKEGRMRWMDIDITALYKILGGKTDNRKYFSVLGHFKDPIKFATHPIRSIHHKGSVIYGMFHEALSGVDWAGRRFTTTPELLGFDKEKGRYKTTRKGRYKKGDPKWGRLKGKTVTWDFKGRGPLNYDQILSYGLSQVRGAFPVQIQNLMSWVTGEMEGFDALLKSAGLRVSTTYGDKKTDKKKKRKGSRWKVK
jgi:hypothetical protein